MPKKLYADPNRARAAKWIEFDKIPVNQYQKEVKDEKDNFSKEDLLRIYHDMRMIREFEEMLNSIKTTNAYNGLDYNNPGPAHLSIGQEAAAVGQAYYLDKDDFIFGSHRSHGEMLAKSFSAIHKMTDAELVEVMENYMEGDVYKVVSSLKEKRETVKKLAISYILYGMLAEIFAKETGFNRGLGGSMHSYFLPFGVYPNNAIVGGSADIALGAALFKKINRKKGVVIANIGDGSLGCGPVWEALMMSAMDQYEKLWEGEMKGGLPYMINVNNNQYAMGGQTKGETMGYQNPSRIGAGVSPSQLHAETVDGFNPLAVIEAMGRKLEILRSKQGPVLMDTVTYRYSGHSPSDADSYRTQEEKQDWMDQDPIVSFRKQVLAAKLAKEAEFEKIDQEVVDVITDTVRLAIDPVLSPRMDLNKTPLAIEDIMFSNQKILATVEGKADMLLSREEENPRVKQISRRERYMYDAKGKPFSKNKTYQYRDALFEAILDKFYEDPGLIAYGEENRDWGGAFAVYRGLTEAVPYHRLFNSPISEAAIVGSAVGYAMAGGRALVELMYCDFLGRAGDEVFNQLPKWQAMSGGLLKMPVVLRVSVGSKYGAQHSQDWTSLCTHIPGLKVVFPVTPYDAKGLMTTALNGSDPVIFFESQRLYDFGEQFVKTGVPQESYEIEIGEPAVRTKGKDLTILTIGATMYRALEAVEKFKAQGIEAELIDARSLVPFNFEKVVESVKKTGKIIISGDACERGSYLSDLAQKISDLCFDYLDAPVCVLGSRNWITPAFELEEHFFPQADWFLDIYHQRIAPMPNYTAKQSFTDVEIERRSKLGV